MQLDHSLYGQYGKPDAWEPESRETETLRALALRRAERQESGEVREADRQTRLRDVMRGYAKTGEADETTLGQIADLDPDTAIRLRDMQTKRADERQTKLTERHSAMQKAVYGVKSYADLAARLPHLQRSFTPEELDDLDDMNADNFDPAYFAQLDMMTDQTAETPAAVREFKYRNALPDASRAEFDRFRKPVPYQYSQEGIAAAGQRQDAVSAAQARHRAPPAASKPYVPSRIINGQKFFNVGGEWYDNPEGR